MQAIDYASYWKQNPYNSRGPIHWRSEHHGQPNADYTALCDAAESQALHVGIEASDHTYGKADERFRRPTAIRLIEPDGTSHTRVEIGQLACNTIGQAARIAHAHIHRAA